MTLNRPLVALVKNSELGGPRKDGFSEFWDSVAWEEYLHICPNRQFMGKMDGT